MNFRSYFKSLDRAGKEAFAMQCGTSVAFLAQIAGGHRVCSADLALDIERESNGAVTVADLRPKTATKLAKGGYVRRFNHHHPGAIP